MNIKSLLIGSAAAIASATVVSAADAIVAAEPEAVEYVRVCDAFGTGFFYIPGTETCLKIGGYARFEVGFGRDVKGTSDWNATSRGQLNFDVRSETELGALRGFIDLRFNADDAASTTGGSLHQGFIELGGFRAGKFETWWDSDLSGETDVLGNLTNLNSIRYSFEGSGWSFGIALDELSDGARTQYWSLGSDLVSTTREDIDNNVGIEARIGADLGGVSFELLGGYDTDLSEGAVRAIVTAQLGPGTLGLAGVWSSGANPYYAASEWGIAAEYAVSVNDRLTITPGVQYFGNLAFWDEVGDTTRYLVNHWADRDAWRAGVTVDYQITEGLRTKITANYYDEERDDLLGNDNDAWTGFIRLDRTF